MDSGADDRLDRPAKEDEQRLREVMCERGGVGVRCHDSPHDEAARPSLRTFHTASEEEFCELRLNGVLGSSGYSSSREDSRLALLENKPRAFQSRVACGGTLGGNHLDKTNSFLAEPL